MVLVDNALRQTFFAVLVAIAVAVAVTACCPVKSVFCGASSTNGAARTGSRLAAHMAKLRERIRAFFIGPPEDIVSEGEPVLHRAGKRSLASTFISGLSRANPTTLLGGVLVFSCLVATLFV